MVEYLKSIRTAASKELHEPDDSSLNALAGGEAADPPEAGAVQRAAEKGIRMLQHSDLRFFQKSGCVACHQQPITSVATAMARERGFSYRVEAAANQTKLYSVILNANRRTFLNGDALGGNQDTTASILFGLSAESYPRTEATDAMAIQLAGRQLDDGSWPTSGHRPPSEYSKVSTSAFAVHALKSYAPPGLKPEMRRRIRAARNWLLRTEPRALQEHAGRLLGLAWSDADEASVMDARRALLAEQREDGGWAQLPTLKSDAYATGLALYALHEGGRLPVKHHAYEAGAGYLVRTQLEDGSWHVRGRSLKFQPYFESGFPHGHDQWISAQATGWAVIALMLD
jgi:hypothetical protein